MTSVEKIICDLDELPDPGAREFTLGEDTDSLPGFVVRQGEKVFAYVNRCPHAGAMLNWGPGKFFTRDKTLLMCSVHGANFSPSTGLCVAGPCKGKSLQPIGVKVVNGQVCLSAD